MTVIPSNQLPQEESLDTRTMPELEPAEELGASPIQPATCLRNEVSLEHGHIHFFIYCLALYREISSALN